MTGSDSSGNKFITVTHDSGGVYVRAFGDMNAALDAAGETSISFEIKLRKTSSTATTLPLGFRLRDNRSGNNNATIINVTSSGAVTLGTSVLNTIAVLNATDFTTLRVVVDFAAGTMTSYTDSGAQKTITFKVANDNGTIGTTLNWLNYMTGYYLECQSTGNGSIQIGGIKIAPGNIFD